jgi:iron complex outermembrane receptor protein
MAGPALNTVAIKDIERIEIVQGSASVLYGDQAVGGVINVITRRAKVGEVNGFISAERGTDNLENYTASITQGFDNGLNYNFSAQKRNADNYRNNNQSELTNFLGNIGLNFEIGKVFLEHQKIEDGLRLAGSLSDYDLAVNRRFTYSPNDFSNQDSDLTRVGGEVSIFEGWKLLGEYADRDETGNYFYDDYYPLIKDYKPYAGSYEMRVKNITPRVVGNMATKNGNAVVTLGYDKVEGDYATKDGYTHIAQEVDGFIPVWTTQTMLPMTLTTM